MTGTDSTETLQTKPAAPRRSAQHAMDAELREFRELMQPPGTFDDGFTWTGLVAALFVSLMMVPGSMYMHLVAGLGMGGAAQWVTVILFLEIARRTHRSLKRAELFVLFYVAGAIMASPFENLLYIQFFIQSKAVAAQGWIDQFPSWYGPSDPEVLGQRTFFLWPWLAPIGMIILKNVISRIDSRILGYGLFKLTSDYEQLPFPLAPVGAQGILALAEEEDESSWRWRAFSIGGALGLIFGTIYLGVPILSHAILGVSIRPLSIPWVDWTGKTEDLLPAVATGMSFDLTYLMLGMVMPFWAVIGAFVGVILTFIANPVLYHAGILKQWRPGDDTVSTLFKNNVDFYFSFTIGLSLAIAVMGIYSMTSMIRRARKAVRERSEQPRWAPPPGRGDIPNWAIIAVYLASSLLYITISGYLIGWHRGVMLVMIFYAYLYTPIISYVTARLEGLAGHAFSIPLAREAGIILSGYQGLAVWFLPIPMQNFGDSETIQYRQAELTGTKFWSIWKADLILVPLILISSIFFANFIWSLSPIPSQAYPYTEKVWELQAMNQTVMYSATTGEFSTFSKAINGWYIGGGLALGLLLATALPTIGLPSLLFYGMVKGVNQAQPHTGFLLLAGALLGRYYFQKRFGKEWRRYVPVIVAGFSCGMGLIAMFCIGITFLSKAVFRLSY